MRLTENRVRADLARMKIAFRRLPDGDYRVCPADRKKEADSYITNDLNDAYEMGMNMGEESSMYDEEIGYNGRRKRKRVFDSENGIAENHRMAKNILARKKGIVFNV